MHRKVITHPTLVYRVSRLRDPFEFRQKTWQAMRWVIGLHFSKKNCMIRTSAVLSQYTRVTTDDRQHYHDSSRPLQ